MLHEGAGACVPKGENVKTDLQKPSHPAPGETFIPYEVGRDEIEIAIMRNADLLPMERLAWLRLSKFAGHDGRCYPSYETLGNELGVRRKYAIRLAKGLEEKGFIKRDNAVGRGNTIHFHFLWHESFLENPLSKSNQFPPSDIQGGNGKGSLQGTISHKKGSLQGTISKQEKGHYRDRKGSLQGTQNLKETEIKKTTTTGAIFPECEPAPDEKSSLSLFSFVDQKKATAQDESLVDEYVNLCASWQAENGGFVKSRGAYKAFLKKHVKKNGFDMDDLEEKRAWKRDRDETEELRRQAREQEEERKRQEEIHRQEFEKLKADLMTEYEQSGMSEEEFFRSKPEDDNQVQCALWELFQDTGRKIAREKFDETIGKPKSKKKAKQKGRAADASLTDEQREALLLRQFESIKDSLASLPHDAETKFCSMQAKLFDRRGDEQGIRCLNKLFHGGRHCALKDEIGRLAEETFNPESTKTTPPQLTFQTFKDIIGDLRSTYGGRKIQEKLCQDYPEYFSRLQDEYPF